MPPPLSHRLAGPVLAAAYHAWWPILQRLPLARRPGRPRRVLLYPYNHLSAEYLRLTADLIRHDPRIALYGTAPAYNDHGATPGRALARQVGGAYVPYLLARLRWWDMILFASHGFTHAFHPDIARILVNHSLTGGKVVDGQNTRYGAASALRCGKPIFTRMFEASDAIRRQAIAQNPVFEPVIALVGDLRVDALLNNLAGREAIRRDFGFAPADRVVLIQSTWGAASLLEAYGQSLLPAARRLTAGGRYRVLLSIHPNHWGDSPYARRHPWGRRALEQEGDGLIVLRPDQKWERFMAAADLAITDHTANAAVFALLNKPLAFVPLPAGVVLSESIEWRLYEACPHVNPAEALQPAVEALLAQGPAPALQTLSRDILSCPGEAKQRMTAELYRVLQLPPPQRP